MIAIPVGTVKAETEPVKRVIFETETASQYARVVEEADGTRKLELNEGVAEHSLYRPGSYLTGNYWDGLVVLPFATLTRAPERVAILGNAAGTAARAYGHYFPGAQIDGVEIDPELADIGRRYFDMHAPHLAIHNEDARPWLRRADGDYDVIVLDAYRQPYIPFYLATREFFELARDRLAPGGVVIVNIGHPEGSSELEQVIGRTMGEAFPVVLRDPIEDDEHAAGRARAAGRPTICARWRPASRPSCRRSRTSRRHASGRLCPAARSTPMTARRWSGWSTARSSATPPGTESPRILLPGLARRPRSRARPATAPGRSRTTPAARAPRCRARRQPLAALRAAAATGRLRWSPPWRRP